MISIHHIIWIDLVNKDVMSLTWSIKTLSLRWHRGTHTHTPVHQHTWNKTFMHSHKHMHTFIGQTD